MVALLNATCQNADTFYFSVSMSIVGAIWIQLILEYAFHYITSKIQN